MAIDFNQNYFQLFELENSFDINYESLEKKYLSFQKSFHPDKFVNASDQEKRISLQIISYINEAYETLKNDYLKSIYLLKINGYEIDDQNTTISDPDFLMHQMELREELEEIEKSESTELKKIFLEKINKHKIDCLNDFKEYFNKHFYDEASKKVKKMKFYISIENEIVRMD